MNKFFLLLAVLMATISPAAGLTKTIQLKETGKSLQCNAVHDCEPPLDCGDGTSNECTPRVGYCVDPIIFSLQPLSSVDPEVTASFVKGKYKDVEFVLSGQEKDVYLFVSGNVPKTDLDRWEILLANKEKIRVEERLVNTIPSVRAYIGTCEVGK
jgi:hypothetical protein